jgi:N-formylmaleamate deformylase
MLTGFLEIPIATGDAAIQCYRLRKDKPSLLLLHGYTDSAVCWNRLVPVLAPNYDLVLIDTRGHGWSTEIGRGLHYHFQVADVVRVLAGLDIQHVGILGHSMGAMTASIVAAKFPHLIDFIILEDPPLRGDLVYTPSDDQFPDPANTYHQLIVALRNSTLEEAAKLATVAHPNWHEAEIAGWVESKRRMNLSIFNKPPHHYPIEWRKIFSQILCPTLLVTGEVEKQGLVSPQIAHDVCSLVRNAQIASIAGAGHSIRRDQFNSFVSNIQYFLAHRN